MAIRTDKVSTRDPFPVPAPMHSGLYKKIAYSFVGVTFLIIFAALWFSSVRATATVSVKREPTNVAIDVDLLRMPKSGELRARVIQGVFEKTDTFKATSGAATTVTGVSRGTVRITNTYSRPQPLVKTTRLLTKDGRLYRISEGVDVPAGGSVDVEAYADEEGGAYDFSAPTAFTIPGLSESMQRVVTAASVSPFTGGQQVVRMVGEEDLAKATEAIKAEALEEAKTTLAKEVADPILNESVFVVNTSESTAGAKVGDNADEFMMSAKVSVTGVFFSRSEMETFIRDRIRDRVPSGRELVSGPNDALTLTYAVASSDALNESARITATANVLTKPTSADNLVSKEAIAGLSVGEAESALKNMPGIEDATVTIRPSWVKRLPTLKDHITIKVK